MGTRGLTGLKSVLLGSVSHAVAQHADRPVLIVPSADVAERRTSLREDVEESEPDRSSPHTGAQPARMPPAPTEPTFRP
jgi:hypothetical protein